MKAQNTEFHRFHEVLRLLVLYGTDSADGGGGSQTPKSLFVFYNDNITQKLDNINKEQCLTARPLKVKNIKYFVVKCNFEKY